MIRLFRAYKKWRNRPAYPVYRERGGYAAWLRKEPPRGVNIARLIAMLMTVITLLGIGAAGILAYSAFSQSQQVSNLIMLPTSTAIVESTTEATAESTAESTPEATEESTAEATEESTAEAIQVFVTRTATIAATPTFTPRPITGGALATIAAAQTREANATPMLAPPRLVTGAPREVEIVVTSPPRIFETVIVIIASPTPTYTPTPTATATETAESTAEATATEVWTLEPPTLEPPTPEATATEVWTLEPP
ncbi:MAG: hypothetical protein HUU31_08090, partial [Anaerolineae bacterium]|nr:hypothetical protein [Anaerolineae bacterium]